MTCTQNCNQGRTCTCETEFSNAIAPDADRCWSGSVEPTRCDYCVVIVMAVMALAALAAGICWGMS